MINPEHIPDEVMEAMMQPLTYPMGTLPSTVFKMRLVAALNAWLDMEGKGKYTVITLPLKGE